MSVIDQETNQAVVTLSMIIKIIKKEGKKEEEEEEEDRFYPKPLHQLQAKYHHFFASSLSVCYLRKVLSLKMCAWFVLSD